MILWARSKYCVSNSRTCSGSRDSAIGVNPTRSTNNTEQSRRSATDFTVASSADDPVARVASVVAPGCTVRETGDPQLAQKGLPLRICAPHDGHSGATRAPQLAQNGLSLGVSPWHAPHCIVASLARQSTTQSRSRVRLRSLHLFRCCCYCCRRPLVEPASEIESGVV